MQFKGLVRFFTILLIIYSLYQLSFTWFVKKHERKVEKLAWQQFKVAHPDAAKFTDADELPDSLQKPWREKLRIMLDSTKDETLTYGITGKVSYDKAKREELNLGLDLQGGMNVTLEVEMRGLLTTLANNSKDANFLKALDNADLRKGNSDADFVTLFAEEYEKLAGPNRLSSLFYAQLKDDDIKIGSTDSQVKTALKKKAEEAFASTFKILTNRIDQFGVAQPSINPDYQRNTISVELPGVLDRERVKDILQSTASLQFFETYPLQAPKIQQAFQGASNSFDLLMKGGDTSVVKKDTIAPKKDTLGVAKTDTAKKQLVDLINDTAGKQNPVATDNGVKKLNDYLFGDPNGSGQILVNVKDTAKVRGFLNEPAIRRNFPGDAAFAYGKRDPNNKGQVALYILKTYNREHAWIEGDQINNPKQTFNQGGQPTVTLDFDIDVQKVWEDMTSRSFNGFEGDKNIKIPIAIVLDGVVLSAPAAHNGPITGGNTEISGNFTVEDAKDLANMLGTGKLSAPAKIVQEQQVGATLGAQAIRNGSMAFLISFIVIFLLMLVYYNTAGWIANIALILNLLFTIGVLTGLGATLTAPGIAGLVLTIGLAVDTNVIIYERIKEELSRGKGYIPAINEGYKRSLPPVLDGHITILLTAIILYSFGLGPVKGFATTQILGILLSLFCGILVSRWVSDIFTSRKRHLEYFTGISRKIFQHAKFKFIEYRKVAYTISFVILALGIASFFNGFHYGVEFDGGHSYIVQFPEKVDVEKVRDDLKVSFEGENAIIKTVESNSRLDITTSYLMKDTRPNVDSFITVKLFEGLKSHLPAGVTYADFTQPNKYIVGSKKVLPTISDDLKRGAIKATIFAILAIFVYIFIRFRDWRYSLGTIIALLHDVFVTLIVFSFAKTIVPFPLEIDQHFIAAVLTVIGFSMNDTVIVFDRIREDRKLYPSAPLAETINRAINETLSRTIMTSLTVFLTILILFLVGGEVTKGFAFAMLIGVITGTYSSIFVASPVLVDLEAKKKPTNKAGTVKATETKSTPAKA
jgi:SecD/SecF fusion protein